MYKMAERKSTQNDFLKDLKSVKRAVKIFLINGFQMEVKIIEYDNFCIIVEDTHDGNKKMIYKHAVSTIEVVK